MEIVENWSRIVGTVQEWKPPEEAKGPALIVIRVEDVGTVVRGHETYRNLLANTKGEVVQVQVPGVDARDLELVRGMHIEVEVRRGRSADKLFAKPGTIVVTR
jgi:hypothetical protein